MNNSSLPMHKSPRCGAKTRRSGKPCQCPAQAESSEPLHEAPGIDANGWDDSFVDAEQLQFVPAKGQRLLEARRWCFFRLLRVNFRFVGRYLMSV
jgi:hypothetical protein